MAKNSSCLFLEKPADILVFLGNKAEPVTIFEISKVLSTNYPHTTKIISKLEKISILKAIKGTNNEKWIFLTSRGKKLSEHVSESLKLLK